MSEQPYNTNRVIATRIPEDLHVGLLLIAQREDRSVSSVMRLAAARFVESDARDQARLEQEAIDA